MTLPWIKWYCSDWLADPCLSMCSPATRGIWMDLLCGIHESGGDGSISGTVGQLAHVCRCTPDQFSAALTELQETRTASVTCNAKVTARNGSGNATVTVTCRRMQRDAKSRLQTRERVSRHRTKYLAGGSRADGNGPCNAKVTGEKPEARSQKLEEDTSLPPLETPGDQAEGKPSKTKAKRKSTPFVPPTVEEVQDYAAEKGYPNFDGQRFVDYYEAAEWHDSHGNPVKNWKQKFLSVWIKDAAESNGSENAQYEALGLRYPTEEEMRRPGFFPNDRMGMGE